MLKRTMATILFTVAKEHLVMAAKEPPSNRRRWILLLIPIVVLLILAGIITLLAPAQAGSSNTTQKTITNENPYPVRTPPPPPTCTAAVKVDKLLASSFDATVVVTNTSNQVLNTWMIYWHLPVKVKFVKGWNAEVFQDGDVIMAHPLSTHHIFPAGGTMSVGFEATGPSNTSVPASGVALNGIMCT